jgi:hypothetical protein
MKQFVSEYHMQSLLRNRFCRQFELTNNTDPILYTTESLARLLLHFNTKGRMHHGRLISISKFRELFEVMRRGKTLLMGNIAETRIKPPH